MSHLNFWILAFFTNFCLLKVTCLVTLFDRKINVFKNSSKLVIFGHFNHFLSTHVNVARFACNVEWDFFCDFQPPCKRPEVFILMEKVANWDPSPLLDLKNRLKMEQLMDHHQWLKNHWKPIWIICRICHHLHLRENEKLLLLKGHIISFGT